VGSRKKSPSKGKQKRGTPTKPSQGKKEGGLTVTTERLWEEIRRRIKDKFQYSLPHPTPSYIFSFSTLRYHSYF
jgi:hypothetical protein